MQNDTHPMLDPQRAMDFFILLLVSFSNPNGDPNNEGRPRITDEGYGSISGPSFKRKIRDFAHTIFQKALAVPPGGSKSELRDKAGTMEKYVEMYWDARLFGGIPGKLPGPKALGHGPVTIPWSNLSIAPVDLVPFGLTCAAGEIGDKGLVANMGDGEVVKHGLYLIHGTYDANRGIQSGVTSEDLRILWDSIFGCYDASRSVFRSNVSIHRMFIQCHPMARRGENTFTSRSRLTVVPLKEMPESIENYTITYDDNGPDGMDFFQFDAKTNVFPE